MLHNYILFFFLILIKNESETINVIASAAGNASQTPVILKRYESKNTLAIITTKPRIIEMINAGAALLIELKASDRKILSPANMKPIK